MSVMTVRYRESLYRTLLFLRRTLSDARHIFQVLVLEPYHARKSGLKALSGGVNITGVPFLLFVLTDEF